MNAVLDKPLVFSPKAVRKPAAKPAPKRIKHADIAAIIKPKKIADLVKAKEVKMDVLWGSDPELNVVSLAEGRIVSSIPILKRDKHDPIDLGDGIRTYADSVQMEASFPPSKTPAEMIHRMKTVFSRMQECLGDQYRLGTKTAHVYEPDQLIAYKTGKPKPRDLIDPNEAGCNPSFSAWDAAAEEIVDFTDGMRSGSFHIHVGHEQIAGKASSQIMRRFELMKLMDIFVGVPSILFDKHDPTNALRRERYGRASSHRMPKYGAEYRVLGSSILASKQMTELSLDLVQHAIDQFRKGRGPDIINAIEPEEVKHAINLCDGAMASKILGIVGLPSDLMARVKKDYGKPDLYTSWGL